MLTYLDFCLKISKIIKEENIESPQLVQLINETIDLLDTQQAPTDTYEEVISKELQFFRNECQYLNKLRVQLQMKLKSLQNQLQEEKESNIELTSILKSQKKDQLLSQTKTDGLSNLQKSEPHKTSYRGYKQMSFNEKQPLLPTALKNLKWEPHLTIEIKNIKTPIMEHHDPKNLRELFDQCVQQIFRENLLRGQDYKKSKQICQRNHLGQFQLSEEDKDIQLTKLDMKTLTERFFLNPQFMRMVEAQIFNVKCCSNKNCLYNFRQAQQTQENEQINPENKLSVPRNLPSFRQDHRSKSVGRNDDSRLQYQYLFAEVLRLERELCSTPKQNKSKVNELQRQLREASAKLVELQCKILN